MSPATPTLNNRTYIRLGFLVLIQDIREVTDGASLPAVAALLPAVPAGFPSPAQDYQSVKVDLNEYLLADRTSTFIVRVAGDSMIGAGIFDGDELIVDRSLTPHEGSVVVAVIDNEMTVKRIHFPLGGRPELHPENPAYPVLRLRDHSELSVWGVATLCLHHV